MSVLSNKEIKFELEILNEWVVLKKSLKKDFTFGSYMESIRFINFLAEKAEKINHHPDLVVGWCKISVRITSHDKGGITSKCVKIAKYADTFFKD